MPIILTDLHISYSTIWQNFIKLVFDYFPLMVIKFLWILRYVQDLIIIIIIINYGSSSEYLFSLDNGALSSAFVLYGLFISANS